MGKLNHHLEVILAATVSSWSASSAASTYSEAGARGGEEAERAELEVEARAEKAEGEFFPSKSQLSFRTFAGEHPFPLPPLCLLQLLVAFIAAH